MIFNKDIVSGLDYFKRSIIVVMGDTFNYHENNVTKYF